MVLSNERAISHIRHVLHGEIDHDLELESIYNDAGRHLLGMHDWKFLERPEATLSTTAGQNWIALPTDFNGVIAEDATESLVNTLTPTTFRELMNLRTYQVQDTSFHFYYVIEWLAQPTVSTELVPRIGLWPTPVTTEAGILTHRYRARWVPPANLDTGVVQVPHYAENAFIATIRAFAEGYIDADRESGVTMTQILAELENDSRILHAKEQDGQQQGSYGPLRNGAVESGRAWFDWGIHSTVQGPS